MLFKVFAEQQDGEYTCFVLMLSVLKPADLLEEIEAELRRLNIPEGKVLFDLTLSNLNKKERYISARFDGLKLDIASFKIVENPPEEYRRKSFEFLSQNYNRYVEPSLLLSAEKFRYKIGY